MSDFNIMIGTVAAPSNIIIPSTVTNTVTVSLVAKDGAAGHNRIVSIDADGALIPTQTPLSGQLDSTGVFKFTLGPGNVLGSFLRGAVSLDISVGERTKTQNVQFV